MPEHTLHNEKQLLRDIADGDERAFFAFYDHYSNLLRPFLWKYTSAQSDIEEIIQETFIKVWINRDTLETLDNPRAWLYRIASNTYLNYVNKLASERKRALKAAGAESPVEMVTPLEKTSVREIDAAIREAVGSLSEQKKRVYLLSREQGLKPADISEQLGIPVGTVKNQLSAALKDIRDYLVAAGHGPILLLCLVMKIF